MRLTTSHACERGFRCEGLFSVNARSARRRPVCHFALAGGPQIQAWLRRKICRSAHYAPNSGLYSAEYSDLRTSLSRRLGECNRPSRRSYGYPPRATPKAAGADLCEFAAYFSADASGVRWARADEAKSPAFVFFRGWAIRAAVSGEWLGSLMGWPMKDGALCEAGTREHEAKTNSDYSCLPSCVSSN